MSLVLEALLIYLDSGYVTVRHAAHIPELSSVDVQEATLMFVQRAEVNI